VYIGRPEWGGYTGGEIASNLATMTVRDYIIENWSKTLSESENSGREEILELIKKAMVEANHAINAKAKENEELQYMGTTLEVCLIYNNRAYIGHIGDSRVYRIRNNIIRKMTADHSYVQELVKDGTITKEEADYHPKKNMLMKAVRK